MEFLRICRDEEFKNVVVSIKTSNTSMMVTTVRRLVRVMAEEGISYPLHLGVTEAGDAEDGRIKSAVGIGALLADGIGDTLRVSLAEAPENEIPVAKQLVDYITHRAGHESVEAVVSPSFNYEEPVRRATKEWGIIGGNNVPVVFGSEVADADIAPDFVIANVVVCPLSEAVAGSFVAVEYKDLTAENIAKLKSLENIAIVASTTHANPVAELRALVHKLMVEGVVIPM